MEGVPVEVFWIPAAAGGRSRLPDSSVYSTVSRWPDQTDEEWSRAAWSVVLECDPPPAKQGNPTLGKARFLADGCPADLLSPGRVFGMYEGRRKVADVRVV